MIILIYIAIGLPFGIVSAIDGIRDQGNYYIGDLIIDLIVVAFWPLILMYHILKLLLNIKLYESQKY